MSKARIVEASGALIGCRVDETLAPSVLRVFAGSTPMDAEVDALASPSGPALICGAIQALRWYRDKIGPRLGQRCVFEPSCSLFESTGCTEVRSWPSVDFGAAAPDRAVSIFPDIH